MSGSQAVWWTAAFRALNGPWMLLRKRRHVVAAQFFCGAHYDTAILPALELAERARRALREAARTIEHEPEE